MAAKEADEEDQKDDEDEEHEEDEEKDQTTEEEDDEDQGDKNNPSVTLTRVFMPQTIKTYRNKPCQITTYHIKSYIYIYI